MNILIPVGPLHQAKSRWAGVWTAQERVDRTMWMLTRVVHAFLPHVEEHPITVLSDDARIRERFAPLGVVLQPDAPGLVGHGAQLRAYSERQEASDGLLVVMGDLPLVRPTDAMSLLQACAHHAVVLVPDRHALGTNAAYFRHPGREALCFGHVDSFIRHKNAHPAAYCWTNDAFAIDLDVPGDLPVAQAWQRRYAPDDDELAAFLWGSHA